MAKKENFKLPVHSLEKQAPFISVKNIQHKNPYDFTKEHRHTYFEVFFFETGGGNQLIDFINYPVKDNSCYIVLPGQVHLLNRKPSAKGFVIQFNEEMIVSSQLKILLHKLIFENNGAIIFEKKPQKLKSAFRTLSILQETLNKNESFNNECALYLLQALLLQLLENYSSLKPDISGDKKLLYQFLMLLEEHFHETHTVTKYAARLNTTEKKLSALTNKHMGLSPLQVIHSRLVLETKRILLFENISHKEIAFLLGFDSAANFSLFIKNKTGYSPSELYTHLVEIHK
ncbi:MAG: AraC family transcriptional regulator [Bacteroidia bacterium]